MLSAKVPRKAKSKYSTGYINFPTLLLLAQAWQLKTAGIGVSEEEWGPRQHKMS